METINLLDLVDPIELMFKFSQIHKLIERNPVNSIPSGTNCYIQRLNTDIQLLNTNNNSNQDIDDDIIDQEYSHTSDIKSLYELCLSSFKHLFDVTLVNVLAGISNEEAVVNLSS